MYEKLIDIGLKCNDDNQSCDGCPHQLWLYPTCQKKLIADLTEALTTVESTNAWNEEAVKHLKNEIDRINVNIHKVLNENAGLISQWLSQKIRQVLTDRPNGEQNESLYN